MIDPDKRKAIFLLHQQGMSVRQIARRLKVSRNALRQIIAQEGQTPQSQRSDKKHIDPELLGELYRDCEGRVQRIYEILTEEKGIDIKYSTLTRMLRQSGISDPPNKRCEHVPDEPGAEMQHDTTVYKIELDARPTKVVASLLYLRYSKRRYLKFYRTFNRFKMKCFFHEALSFWGYTPRQCIIDNTNLARLRGLGSAALIVPEMEAFGRQYGFQFICHARGHPNRKAGEERSFWTVETNFFPGRSFKSMEELNQQALAWATQRMEHRPQGKARLIPAKAFEHECVYLSRLPEHLPEPYRVVGRGTDQYGYVAFDGNYYWVPEIKCRDVRVLVYADRLKLFFNRQYLIEYPLPADGVKNKDFTPDRSPAPRYQPNNRKRPADQEEKRLRAMATEVSAYLDFALKTKGIQRHLWLRRLLGLSRKMSPELFIKTLQRAGQYRITELTTIERIALLLMSEATGALPVAQVDESFQQRQSYQEGCLTELPDLSIYDQLTEEQTNSPESP